MTKFISVRALRALSARRPLSTIPQSTSKAFEALLYLRRSSELLTGSGLEITKSRVDLSICELQEALASVRQAQPHC
jgi:hypothetical protein